MPQNQTELIGEIDRIFAEHDLAYWADRLDDAGCVWALASTLDEVVHDPELRSQGAFHEIGDADGPGRAVEVLTVPFSVAGSRLEPHGPAPQLGEHSHELLLESGLSEEEIRQIAADSILG